ncbi:MAG: Rpn family recombination-promoting nuclease/putative transposase, partial [Deltaproteobacteria bacterium]|nr:Rpn family recombination-promoting nuclease/putative transposase [Deltaproteobacteria bacterium]
RAIFDLYCEAENGEKFIVELQKAKQNFFKDRSVFYSTFPIRDQAEKGDWSYELKAVYTIGILDFVFDEDKDDPGKYVYKVKLSDVDTHKVFYDKLTLVYLEIPKFNKSADKLETQFEKWLYLFKNLHKLTERPVAFQKEIFKKLFKQASIAAMGKKELSAYEDSLKYYRDMKNVIDTARDEGREEGREEGELIGEKRGREEGQREMLIRLLRNKFEKIPASVLSAISAASHETLLIWLDRVLVERTIESVFKK